MSLPRSAFFFMVASSVLVALASYRFFFLGFSLSFPGMSGHLDNSLVAFTAHIVAAPITLFLGTLQFFPSVQKRRTLHRRVGRLYGLGVLVAGVAGFWVAIGAEGGVVARLGFAALASAWLAVTVIGVAHARARRFIAHRRWMIRSFALTFAGVMLRLQLLGFSAAGLEYTEASVFLAWTCWLPNILVVEWWLSRQSSEG